MCQAPAGSHCLAHFAGTAFLCVLFIAWLLVCCLFRSLSSVSGVCYVDVPMHRKLEITHFFNTYRDLEATADTQTKVLGLRNRAAALEEISKCAGRYTEMASS